MSVTPPVLRPLIFSTPPTMTTSKAPEAMAMAPMLMATPELAQASSILAAGTGVMPNQSASRAAV